MPRTDSRQRVAELCASEPQAATHEQLNETSTGIKDVKATGGLTINIAGRGLPRRIILAQ
jgi:hypothetical protein